MAHYAYKAACYDIDRIKYQELVNQFEEEEGREHDGDSNYDGDNWYIMAMWINELRAKVAELESQASTASVPEGYVVVPVDALIRWRNAFSEELSAWDIDPPLHHVQTSYGEICALLAAAPTPPVSEDRWLPIETAPRNGQYGVGFHPTYANRFWLLRFDEAQTLEGFTHWLPLPKAPAMQEDKP